MEKEIKEAENKLVFELSKEYRFDGKPYKSVNLEGLENMTAEDMIAVNRCLTRSGNIDSLQETTLEYACEMAARCSDQPVEFYRGLPPKDAIKLKRFVANFFYGAN